MSIRKMALADYDGVYALWAATPGMGLNPIDDAREGFARYLARNPDTCFAAWEDGRIVGALLAGHDGRRGYLYHAAVLPEMRGRGIGTALLDAAIEALERAGIRKAALVAFSANEAGNAFWEKRGFIRRDDLTYRNLALEDWKR